MAKQRTKQLRTLADLHQSLCLLYLGAKCKADKVSIKRHSEDGVTTRDYYEGEIWISRDSVNSDPILVREQGPTLIDVLVRCRAKLIEAIEERARHRQLSHQPDVVSPPKRLTHS